MQIERNGAGWYLSVDGGTDGGEIVAGECRGPFERCPELVGRSEEMATGASGETLRTVTYAFRAGEHLFTVREQFWLSPTDGRQVKLLEAVEKGTRFEDTTQGGACGRTK